MRKIRFFSFFSFFLSYFFLSIVNDDGVGADIDDIGDFEIEDDNETPIVEEKTPEPKKEDNNDNELKVLREQIEEQKAWKEEQEQIQATNIAIASLTEKYPDFDANKIGEYLQKVAKDEGEESAEALNNPLGWENIYLTQFKKESKNNEVLFDRGRGETKEPFDFKKGFEKAYSGDKNALAELLENSK